MYDMIQLKLNAANILPVNNIFSAHTFRSHFAFFVLLFYSLFLGFHIELDERFYLSFAHIFFICHVIKRKKKKREKETTLTHIV